MGRKCHRQKEQWLVIVELYFMEKLKHVIRVQEAQLQEKIGKNDHILDLKWQHWTGATNKSINRTDGKM